MDDNEDVPREDCPNRIDLYERIGGIGKCLLKFFQYLASREFYNIPHLNFMQPNLGYYSIYLRGQWHTLHRVMISCLIL
jgi:hypothetical protein